MMSGIPNGLRHGSQHLGCAMRDGFGEAESAATAALGVFLGLSDALTVDPIFCSSCSRVVCSFEPQRMHTAASGAPDMDYSDHSDTYCTIIRKMHVFCKHESAKIAGLENIQTHSIQANG